MTMRWRNFLGKPPKQPEHDYHIGGMQVTVKPGNSSHIISDVIITGGNEATRDGLDSAIKAILDEHFTFHQTTSYLNDDRIEVRFQSFVALTITDARPVANNSLMHPKKPELTQEAIIAVLEHLQRTVPDERTFVEKLRQIDTRMDGRRFSPPRHGSPPR